MRGGLSSRRRRKRKSKEQGAPAESGPPPSLLLLPRSGSPSAIRFLLLSADPSAKGKSLLRLLGPMPGAAQFFKGKDQHPPPPPPKPASPKIPVSKGRPVARRPPLGAEPVMLRPCAVAPPHLLTRALYASSRIFPTLGTCLVAFYRAGSDCRGGQLPPHPLCLSHLHPPCSPLLSSLAGCPKGT